MVTIKWPGPWLGLGFLRKDGDVGQSELWTTFVDMDNRNKVGIKLWLPAARGHRLTGEQT